MKTLQEVLTEHPGLHDGGYGAPPERRWRASIGEWREKLEDSQEPFDRAVAWIQANLRPARRFNHRHTSYGLKHIAEPECGYVTNGVFIAAMLACGFEMSRRHGGYDPSFKMEFIDRRKILRLIFG